MKEYLFNAGEEFKRADHLLYVSLKYSRTADVLRSLIERLISTYNYIIEGLIEKAFEERQIEEIPKTPKEKVDVLRKIYSNRETLLDYMDFYFMLRKILRSKYSSFNEFRRHLTMISEVDGKSIEVTIDIISDYYKRTKEFFDYVETQILENEH